MRLSIGYGVRDAIDERSTSFEDRFEGERITKRSSMTATGYRLASLEMPAGTKALFDAGPVLVPSVNYDILVRERSDSFAERFAGNRDLPSPLLVRAPETSWVVQLIGDNSEAVALSRFRQLQDRRKSILGIYEPLVVRTTLNPGAEPIWVRVRVGLSSRKAAESLCAQLEEAGERCVVQRNSTS
jgi:SPOR domain